MKKILKKLISTSKPYANHPYSGQNTQKIPLYSSCFHLTETQFLCPKHFSFFLRQNFSVLLSLFLRDFCSTYEKNYFTKLNLSRNNSANAVFDIFWHRTLTTGHQAIHFLMYGIRWPLFSYYHHNS